MDYLVRVKYMNTALESNEKINQQLNGSLRQLNVFSSHLFEQTEDDEKLKKRKERFGIVTSSAGAGTTEDTEVKMRRGACSVFIMF